VEVGVGVEGKAAAESRFNAMCFFGGGGDQHHFEETTVPFLLCFLYLDGTREFTC
jgi:hypothetical protein